jgi:hypothetical protein
VSDTDEDLALIATAASLDAVSSENPGDETDAWNATADAALEAAARDTLSSYVSSSCAMTSSIGPRPFDLTVGAWNDEIRSRDHVSVDCDNYSATFVQWTTDTVGPLGAGTPE